MPTVDTGSLKAHFTTTTFNIAVLLTYLAFAANPLCCFVCVRQAREKCATAGAQRLGQQMSTLLRDMIAPYFLRRTKAQVSASERAKLRQEATAAAAAAGGSGAAAAAQSKRHAPL